MTGPRRIHPLDRIIARSFERPLPIAAQYGLALGVVGSIGAFRALVVTDQLPWLLFIPAILGIALVTGRRPGLAAAAFATLLGAASIGGGAGPGWLSGPQWASTILFGLVSAVLVLLTGALRTSMRQARSLNLDLAQGRIELVDRENFLSSVLASSTDCIKVLDLDGNLTFMTEGGQKVMEVSDFNRIAGCPWPDFWKGAGQADAIAAIEAARHGRSASFVGHAATLGGNGRWWHVAVSPIPGPDGRPDRILSVSRDITALRDSEERREHYARMVENSADLIGMARLDGGVFFLNDAGRRLVGLDQEDLSPVRMADLLAPEQVDSIEAEILPAVERHGHWSGERLFRHHRTGEPIPVSCTMFPLRDADRRLIGLGTVTRDIREQKRVEEQQAIVNGEIAHRLKNTLAMVQSIATMTLRRALPPEELARFDERLQALARAHDLLHRGNWHASDLEELAAGVLENLGVDGRCTLAGPAVRFGARAAMSTSLLLHELGTNAVKHGALSAPGGTVGITWRVGHGPSGRELALSWQERGGPPAVAPVRKGFGSRLVSLGLVGTGGADVRYTETGLEATFRADEEQIERA